MVRMFSFAIFLANLHATHPQAQYRKTPACAIGDHQISCNGSPAVCVLGGRFRFPAQAIQERGDINDNAMIRGGEGLGKLVAEAEDVHKGSRVFLKCSPPPDGRGTVAGVQAWRGAELEGALHGEPHVLTAVCSIAMADGGECRVYPLAQQSLTDAVVSRRLQGIALLQALLQVSEGIAAIHRAGFCHRDIKHRNILQKASHEEAGGSGGWAVADVDAAAKEGDVIHEFMGYPWSVWQPNIQIGPWPSAVPSPEHARYLQELWSRSRDAPPQPLIATAASDLFQLGVLIFEAICSKWVLTGLPGNAVLKSLASPAAMQLPACHASGDIERQLLHLADTLMHKEPASRSSITHVIAVMRRLVGASQLTAQQQGVLSTQEPPATSSGLQKACVLLDCCFTVKV